jgi:hypothetical protein
MSYIKNTKTTGNKPFSSHSFLAKATAKLEIRNKPNMNAQLLPHRPYNTGSSFVGSGVLQAYHCPYGSGYPAYNSYL